MSRIYFHSIDEDAEVRGSERAHFGVFCQDLTWSLIGRQAEEYSQPSPLRSILPEGHYLKSSTNFSRDARNVFCGLGSEFVFVSGRKLYLFDLQLNTALCLGNDFVKLAARIHGQCEIHCYVEGPNREWLSQIIQKGLDSGFYREGQGWPDVIKLIGLADDSPVVMSYSVCEKFPNSHVAKWKAPIVGGEENTDAWYDLPDLERWNTALDGLRNSGGGLEIKPSAWEFPEFHFNTGETASWLLEEIFNNKEFAK